jgi:hypothetical protein
MRRGPGVELSDGLFARRLAKRPRHRLKGGTLSSKVLHLSVRTLDGGCISNCLNTSEEAKAIERARPIIAKAVDDRRIRPNSLVALAYTPTRSAKPVCCQFDHVSGRYLTHIMRLDGTPGIISLGTGDDELAKDRMRIVVAEWLARGIILPTGKAARIYGPGGLDAEFGSETLRLKAERWFADKCRSGGLKATMYTADEVETLHAARPRVDAQVEAEAKRLAAVPLANYELKLATVARHLGLDRAILDLLVKHEREKRSGSSSLPTSSESTPADHVGMGSVNRHAASRARARARKAGKLIPIAGSAWQFKPGPKQLWFEFSPGRFTAVITIARHTYRWNLAARSAEEADRIAAPVLQTRVRVGVAAAHWRACERDTRAAAEADDNLLKVQTEYLKALVEAGAERANDWGDLAKVRGSYRVRRPWLPFVLTARRRGQKAGLSICYGSTPIAFPQVSRCESSSTKRASCFVSPGVRRRPRMSLRNGEPEITNGRGIVVLGVRCKVLVQIGARYRRRENQDLCLAR